MATLPLIHCAQHVQQSITSMQLPIGLQYEAVQLAEVFQREYVLVGRARLYLRLNVANTVQLSKRHSYCLQSHNRGRKDRPLEPHLIANDHDK